MTEIELPKKGDIVSYLHLIPGGKKRGIGVVEEVCKGQVHPMIVLRGGPVLFPTIGDYFSIEETSND